MLIYPYSSASKSARALANALGCRLAKREGEAIRTDILINWGCTRIRRDVYGEVLNAPQAVAVASNKLKTFQALDRFVPIPQFTANPRIANLWLDAGITVFGRKTLTGHSGEGIVIYDEAPVNENIPLFTQYVKKKNEYRLHVSQKHGVFFIQRKARKKDVPDDQVNWKIRNHANGFIFAHQGVDVSQGMKDACILGLALLKLDFGAFDVIETVDGAFYVLEVNTACGLEGTTLEKYKEIFNDY